MPTESFKMYLFMKIVAFLVFYFNKYYFIK